MRVRHTFPKRFTAFVLSLLLIAALLPSGAIALEADHSEILSFEQGNPVASISFIRPAILFVRLIFPKN